MQTLRTERRLAGRSRVKTVVPLTARSRFPVLRHPAGVLSMLPLCAMLAIGVVPASVQAAGPTIQVLSNRADLISGGDALVQVNLPPTVNPAIGVKVSLNGALINDMFAVRANGRYQGLVTGLA